MTSLNELGAASSLFLQRVAFFTPAANSAIHGDNVTVSHYLQVIGGQGRAKTSAAIKYEFGLQVGIFGFNVALDDALPQVNGAWEVVGIEFAIFADVDENDFVAAIQTGLDLINVGFANPAFCIFYYFQKAWWMFRCHVASLNSDFPEFLSKIITAARVDLRLLSRPFAGATLLIMTPVRPTGVPKSEAAAKI